MASSNITYLPPSNFSNSQNNTNDIVQISLFALIIIFASTYIVLVLSHRTFRAKKFNWLAVNVCFSSIIFAFIQLLSSAIHIGDISETTISCRSKGFIISTASYHIMYSHCIAAFCRLLSVQYPHRPLFRSSHWLLGNIAMSEIMGTLLAVPNLFFDGFPCSADHGKGFLRIYTAISTVLVPILIVFGCNIAIFRYVRQSTKRVQDTNNRTPRLSHRDMYLCKIILLTFCVFFIGWVPLFIEQLFLTGKISISSGLLAFFQILPPVCLLADVLLLIYSDQPVRKLLLKTLTCYGRLLCLFK